MTLAGNQAVSLHLEHCAIDPQAVDGIVGPFVHALIAGTPLGVAVFDIQGRYVLVNDRLAAINGKPAADHIGRRIGEIAPAVRDWNEPPLARALAGENVAVDFSFVTPDGVFRACSVDWFPVAGPAGGIVGAAAVVRETTEHERPQHALAEAYAELQALFENVSIGLAVYDRDLRAVRINHCIAEWNGLDSIAAVGQHVSQLFPERWPAVQGYFERALRGETFAVQSDRTASGRSNGPAHLSIVCAPVRLDGAVSGVMVCAVDDSDRMERQRALEAESRFREDIIHVASHELRTPLTSIIGLVQRLERLAGASEGVTLAGVQDDLTLIRGESERMARTLDLIVDLVGIDAGVTELEREPVVLGHVVRRQVRMLMERYPRIRIHEQVAAELVVDSDGDRIAQVITNLLENAAKYAGPEADVTVRVRLEEDSVAVDVQDDGPGIPIHEQGAIFERRYRGHTGRGATGLGLGLYISRLIATRLGGSLTVMSTPAQGTTFKLRLPIAAQTP